MPRVSVWSKLPQTPNRVYRVFDKPITFQGDELEGDRDDTPAVILDLVYEGQIIDGVPCDSNTAKTINRQRTMAANTLYKKLMDGSTTIKKVPGYCVVDLVSNDRLVQIQETKEEKSIMEMNDTELLIKMVELKKTMLQITNLMSGKTKIQIPHYSLIEPMNIPTLLLGKDPYKYMKNEADEFDTDLYDIIEEVKKDNKCDYTEITKDMLEARDDYRTLMAKEKPVFQEITFTDEAWETYKKDMVIRHTT